MLALTFRLSPKARVPNLKSPGAKPKAPENAKRCFGTNTSLCMLALAFRLSSNASGANTKSQSPNPTRCLSPKAKVSSLKPEAPKHWNIIFFWENTSLCMLALTFRLSPKARVPNLKSPGAKPKAPENAKRCFGTNTSLCMLALTFGLSPSSPRPKPKVLKSQT